MIDLFFVIFAFSQFFKSITFVQIVLRWVVEHGLQLSR